MLSEGQTPCPTIHCRPYAQTPRHRVTNDRDDTIRELRDIWPATVDLAKEPCLIYRLHALLNA